MATIERTSPAPGESEKQPNPTGDPRLFNGVNICRLVLAAAALAALSYAFAEAQYFFVLLAGLSLLAIFVKNRNVRSILAAIAAVEAMYFFADIFSPLGGSILRNFIMVAVAVVVHVAIMRLRFWESRESESLHPHLMLLAGTVGVLLIISAAMSAFAPVTSRQISASNTNAQCGSVLVKRDLPGGWHTIPLPLIGSQCGQARQERISFALLQLEVGIGAIYVGRRALRRQPNRLLVLSAVIALVSGGVGIGWSSAAVSNANVHDRVLAPWMNRYADQFTLMSAANVSLRDAIKAGDSTGVASACNKLQAIGSALAPSAADWPTDNKTDKANWQRFVDQYSNDATSCVRTASLTTSKDQLQQSEWFNDSSATLGKLRGQLNYR